MTSTASPGQDSGSLDRKLLAGTLVTDGTITDDGVLAIEGDRIIYAGPASGYDSSVFDGAGFDRAGFDGAGFDCAGFDGADTTAAGSPEGSGGIERLELPGGSLILPGLIDVHNHGGNGGDFPGAEEASARKAVDFLHRSGTTTLLASMVTASREDLLRGIGVYLDMTLEGLLAGIHLEGPFLSHARCGAQDPQWLREPDLELMAELIDAGQGEIVTMTYAPELPGAAALVDLLTVHGITPSLGHTDCDTATAAASLAQARDGLSSTGFDGTSGRPTVTHLFNGMPPMHHRSPGPVAACLTAAKSGYAAVELVADGTHLDPQTVRMVFELVGAANVLLVTDSMAAAGLSDGRYMLGPSPVTVTGGVATLDATGSIAGGTATLLDVLRRTIAAGIPLQDAVLSATAVPAGVLGLSDEVGGLRRGLRADAIVVDADLRLSAVLRQGAWLQAWS
ncbi:amidohydrolase family protein [Paenarthrobacter sp. PH39-S1]|uniref:N-acetylglucosamine-6-phosphate deacetylase n=1 Tax=Paenarthrobacter sp. PH39-S1 TaxID=3046204 RepID=UPI0024BBC299|nr:amidohydrolase family protein [Paenarthrobacter sp. PH39-S1]MDJ0357195.1 amidohydrolase family protein [Paenarthrobacter sp. PH39-S1]